MMEEISYRVLGLRMVLAPYSQPHLAGSQAVMIRAPEARHTVEVQTSKS